MTLEPANITFDAHTIMYSVLHNLKLKRLPVNNAAVFIEKSNSTLQLMGVYTQRTVLASIKFGDETIIFNCMYISASWKQRYTFGTFVGNVHNV